MAIRALRAETANQHLPFAGETGAFLNIKFGFTKRLANATGDCPGGQRGALCSQPGQTFAEIGRPEFRVLCGGKAIEKKGINRGVDRTKLRGGIAKNQGQGDLPLGQMQAVKTGCQQRPVLLELQRLFCKFRPGLVGDGEIRS